MKKVVIIFSIIYIIFALTSSVFANYPDIESFNNSTGEMKEYILENRFKKYETDQEGEYYRPKNYLDYETKYTPMSVGVMAVNESNEKAKKIIEEKAKEYFDRLASEETPIEQRIEKDYFTNVNQVYSITSEKPYNEGDEIVAQVNLATKVVDEESNYWKENYTKNEYYLTKIPEVKDYYYLRTYYYIRLTISQETGKYEITYIGREPEDYRETVEKYKQEGIDLENLDIKKIINTKYQDEAKAVPLSTTETISGEKTDYNSAEVDNLSMSIKTICAIILLVFIVIIFTKNIIKDIKNR